jgi:deoxyadenosine/deoxycytidine kinase
MSSEMPPTTSQHLVLIAGNLGTGKTTLAQRLAKSLGWTVIAEAVEENPYLADFYGDMRLWSFHLQLYFLGVRAGRHIDAAGLPNSAILDRSIYEDAFVFARVLRKMEHISDRDYSTYLQLYTIIEKQLRSPDLILYLTAPVNVLLDRIRKRALLFDQNLTSEYITMIQSSYEDWISSVHFCPILRLNTEAVDYSSQAVSLDLLIRDIRETLDNR